MIKKSIAYIEKICKDVENGIDPMNPDPISGAYEEGSKDIAENVLNGLEGLDNLYSIYELNPYAPGSDKWEEIAVTRSPDTARDLSEALCKDHNGQIDLRYEALNNTVYGIRKEGTIYRHFPIGG